MPLTGGRRRPLESTEEEGLCFALRRGAGDDVVPEFGFEFATAVADLDLVKEGVVLGRVGNAAVDGDENVFASGEEGVCV